MRNTAEDTRLVYLVRHGATDANAARIYEGRGDGDISSLGVLQAQRAADALADKKIVALYSSPRRRALHTATIISSKIGLDPIPLEGMAEVDFGEWDGLTFDEIQERSPAQLERWIADPLHSRPPGGESLVEMWARVRRCLGVRILGDWRMSDAGSIAIVSHGGPIRAILSFAAWGDLSAFQQIAIGPGEIKVLAEGQMESMGSSGQGGI